MVTKITSFPGEKVDQHLKRYGHLPGDENSCCAWESFCEGKDAVKERIKDWIEKNKNSKHTEDYGIEIEELLEYINLI